MPSKDLGADPVPVSQRLDELANHQWATVLGLEPERSEEERELALRLSEIGFVPGEAVCIMARGMPGHEPLAVRLGHTTFALRRAEAALVRVTQEASRHG